MVFAFINKEGRTRTGVRAFRYRKVRAWYTVRWARVSVKEDPDARPPTYFRVKEDKYARIWPPFPVYKPKNSLKSPVFRDWKRSYARISPRFS